MSVLIFCTEKNTWKKMIDFAARLRYTDYI